MGGKNSKSEWWNDEVRVAVTKNEIAWKALAASNKNTKERCTDDYKEKSKSKKKVNEQF